MRRGSGAYIKAALKVGILILPPVFLAAIILFLISPLPAHRIGSTGSLRVFSTEGSLLREFSSPESGAYGIWQSLDRFSPLIIKGVIKAEDKRFYLHPGFDPIAIGRSAYLNIKAGKIVSGGSTITQQLVRVTYSDILPENKYLRKITEIMLALRLEVKASKDKILEAYLNRVPMKFNQKGLPSGARRIFGRDISLITEEEGIALIVLIRENQASRENFRHRYNSLMKKVTGEGNLPSEEMEKKIFSNAGYSYRNIKSGTLHFEDFIKSLKKDASGDIKTSLSANLNSRIGDIISAEMKFLEPYGAENCSVIVLKLPDKKSDRLELKAMIGSENFHSSSAGQVNGSLSIRQAGSTLKPLVYGYAMDQLNYRPWSIINDEPLAMGIDKGATYSPKNNDLRYWGAVTIREALACSRNVPAVFMVERIGVSQFYRFLKKAGYSHLDLDPSHYGPGLALGTGGTSLLQLCRAYSAIAAEGELLPLYIGEDSESEISLGKRKKLFSANTAYRLTHILSDREARIRAFGKRNFLDFPFDAASKTGTSKDFRDSWTVGFTEKYLVGVWVGNFSGNQMNSISGGWGAGRIYHQVMRLVTGNDRPAFVMPHNFRMVKICRATGLEAGKGCRYFMEPLEINETLEGKCSQCLQQQGYSGSYFNESGIPEIISPVHGESFVIDPMIPLKNQHIPLTIYPGNEKCPEGIYYYSVNRSRPLPLTETVKAAIEPRRGRNIIEIYCSGETINSAEFTVE